MLRNGRMEKIFYIETISRISLYIRYEYMYVCVCSKQTVILTFFTALMAAAKHMNSYIFIFIFYIRREIRGEKIFPCNVCVCLFERMFFL